MLLVKHKGVVMVSRGDALAKAAVKSWLYEGEHFLKVSSIVQHFGVAVDFFLNGIIFLC